MIVQMGLCVLISTAERHHDSLLSAYEPGEMKVIIEN